MPDGSSLNDWVILMARRIRKNGFGAFSTEDEDADGYYIVLELAPPSDDNPLPKNMKKDRKVVVTKKGAVRVSEADDLAIIEEANRREMFEHEEQDDDDEDGGEGEEEEEADEGEESAEEDGDDGEGEDGP